MDIAIAVVNAVNTVINCYNSGVSLTNSLIAGGIELLFSMVYVADLDFLAECFVDLTFGLGFSLASSGITKGIERASTKPTPSNSSTQPKPQATAASKPPQGVAPGYKPRYNGFGWPSAGHTHGEGYRIPSTSNTGFIR